MFFFHPRHSFHSHQLRHPSFAYMLAHPEERTKQQRCHTHHHKPRHHPRFDTRLFHHLHHLNQDNGNSNYMHVSEEEERFVLYTDLPGVKVEDLTVEITPQGVLRIHGERKRNNGNGDAIQFDRQFLMDDKLLETDKVTAHLVDGSLQIVAPKKQPTKPIRVAVVAGAAPDNNNDKDDDSIITLEVDVPGVKINALKVEVDSDGKLAIVGERTRGARAIPLERTFALDTSVVDTDKLEAFLEDGVLTLRVPVKARREESRVIAVSTEDVEVVTNAEVEEKEDANTEHAASIPQEAETVVHDNIKEEGDTQKPQDDAGGEEFDDIIKKSNEVKEDAEDADDAKSVETESSSSSESSNSSSSSSDSEDDFEVVVPETVTEDE